LPTAVLPLTAKAGVDSVSTATIAAKIMRAALNIVLESGFSCSIGVDIMFLLLWKWGMRRESLSLARCWTLTDIP
jgi:hypothetical protein